ncbi:hypothetical protein Tco_0750967 [Tanacetum coccineum]|uniref:Uncharacterized protein n=1 Tax=Tanacetum coccineum TaxID=301880 RepID=A0ABQ4Z3V4_9ASTR
MKPNSREQKPRLEPRRTKTGTRITVLVLGLEFKNFCSFLSQFISHLDRRFYGRRVIRRIGNYLYAFSCEELALIRRISFSDTAYWDEQKNQRTESEPKTRLEPRRTKPELESPVLVLVLEFKIFVFLSQLSVPTFLKNLILGSNSSGSSSTGSKSMLIPT